MSNTITPPDFRPSSIDTWPYPAGSDPVGLDTQEAQQARYADYLADANPDLPVEQGQQVPSREANTPETAAQAKQPEYIVESLGAHSGQPSQDELHATARVFSAYDTSPEALAARAQVEQAAKLHTETCVLIERYGPSLEIMRENALKGLN